MRSRRTILDALPDEAKNQEKQKSGRQGQKKRSSAAFSAAPEAVPIILGANGMPISAAIDKSSDHTTKRQVKQNLKRCPNCHELYAANQQLNDALKVHASVTTDKLKAQKSDEEQFELCVPFKPLLRHMINFVDSHGVMDRVSFTGKLNIQTRKVADVSWFYT